MKLNVALMAGGDSSEREVSLGSAAQIEGALDRKKYNVYKIDVQGREWKYTAPDGHAVLVDRNDFSLPIGCVKVKLDYVLIMIHGTPGEDGKLQAYLEMMNVPFSSCGMVSSVITFDKQTCKQVVKGTGVNLAREIFISKGDTVGVDGIVKELGLPLFVKPNASGSSCGVTKVKTTKELLPAIEEALKEGDDVLIEEFIEGREFGCGVMVAGGREYIFPVTEIISKKEFFDYQAKYTAGMSDEITPAMIEDSLAHRIQQMALSAYRRCRCRGVVRIDFIVTPEGEPYMIEINSIPGMSNGSIVPKQAAAAGMTLGELYDIIIADTRKR